MHYHIPSRSPLHTLILSTLALLCVTAGNLHAASATISGTTVYSTNQTFAPFSLGDLGSVIALNVTSTGNLTINNGSTTTADNSDVTDDALANAGRITVDGATLSLIGWARFDRSKRTFYNTGTIDVINGGLLESTNNTGYVPGGTNAGTINIGSGSTFNIKGNGSKAAYTQTGGTLNIDGTLTRTSTGAVIINGGTLSGNGIINGAITLGSTSAVIAPGGTSAVGTLTFNNAQTWNSGFTLNWQRNATSSDLLKLNSALTLSLTASYTLNLSTLGTAPLSLGAAEWNLVTSTGITGLNTANWNFSATQASFLASTGYDSATLKLIQRGNSITLALWDGSTFIYRENIQNNTWNNTSASYSNIWDGSPTRTTQAGDSVYFIRNQTAPATIALSEPATLGNLTIGSENTSTSYTLTGSSITFNSGTIGISSTLAHLSTAQTGDTILSNLILNSDLSVNLLSNNPLTINGTITGAQNLTLTGGGNLSLNTNTLTAATDNNIAVANLTINNAAVSHNHGTAGNGIYNPTAGTIAITGANLTNIVTAGNGIYSAGNLNLTNAELANNVTNTNSIGIYHSGAGSTFSNSNITQTVNTGATGLYNTGNIILKDTARFINNVNSGNGIYIDTGTLSFTDRSYLENNIAAGAIGIYAAGPFIMEKNATLHNNITGGNGIIGAGEFDIRDYVTVNYTITENGTGLLNEKGDTTIAGNATINGNVTGIFSTGMKIAQGTIYLSDNINYLNDVRSGNGVWVTGGFSVNKSATFNNTVSGGNGIWVDHGTTSFSDNSVLNQYVSDGTGIYVQGPLSLTKNATLHNNVSGGIGIYGAGEFNLSDYVTITFNITNNATGLVNPSGNSTFAGNTTITGNVGFDGSGGVSIQAAGGTIHVTDNTSYTQYIDSGIGILGNGDLIFDARSTFNNTVSKGDGIHNTRGTTLLTGNSTFTSNISGGNGIYNTGTGNITINGNSTLIHNISGGNGIYGDAQVTLAGYAKFINNVTNGTGIVANGPLSIGDNVTVTYDIAAGATGLINTSGDTIFSGNSTISGNVTGGTNIDNTGTGRIQILGNASYSTEIDTGTGIIARGSGFILNTNGTFTNNVLAGTGLSATTGSITITGNTTYNALIGTSTTAATGINAGNSITITGNSKFNQTIKNGTGISTADGNITITGNTHFTQNISGGNGIETHGRLTIGDVAAANATLFTQNISGGNGIHISGGNTTLQGANTRFNTDVTAGNGILVSAGNLVVQTAAILTTNASAGNGILITAGTIIVQNDASRINLYGTGVQLLNDTAGTIIIQNDASISVGASAILENKGNLTFNSGRLNVDGILNSTTEISMLGVGGSYLSGTGTINATLNTGNSTLNTISAGILTTIGTITFGVDQSWDGVSLAWQMGNATFGPDNFTHSGTGNDLFKINGALSLNANARYLVNLASIGSFTNDIVRKEGNSYYWTILQASSISGFDIDHWDFSNTSTLLSTLGLSSTGVLSIDDTISNQIRLKLTIYNPDSYSWLSGNTTGYWTDTAWSPEESPRPDPDAQGIAVRMEEDQTAHTTITINDTETDNKTIGALYIGSSTGDANTTYTLTGGNINFVGNSTINRSSIEHHANSQLGDTITSNLIINANELVISAYTKNALLLTGTITGTQHLTITSANLGLIEHLTTTGNGIDVASIDFTDSIHFINTATGSSTGILHDSGGLIRITGTNGTLFTNNLSDSATGIHSINSTIRIEDSATYIATIENGNGIRLQNSTLTVASLATASPANITSTVNGNGTAFLADGTSSINLTDTITYSQFITANGTGIHLQALGARMQVGGHVRFTSSITADGNAILLADSTTFLANDNSLLNFNLADTSNAIAIRLDGNSAFNLKDDAQLIINIAGASTGFLLNGTSSLNLANGSDFGIELSHSDAIGLRLRSGTTLNVTDESTLKNTLSAGNALLLENGSNATFNSSSTLTQTITGGTGISIANGASLDLLTGSTLSQAVIGTSTYDIDTDAFPDPTSTGIYNEGRLTIDTNTIHISTTNNTSTTGTEVDGDFAGTAIGIHNNKTGDLHITGNTTYSQTVSDRLAAGILNENSATFTIDGYSTLTTTTTGDATGIWNQKDANLQITGNATLNNDVTGGGAGIYNAATLLIDGYAKITSNVSAGTLSVYSDGLWNDEGGQVTIGGNVTYINDLRYGSENTGIYNNATLSTITLNGSSTFYNLVNSGDGFYNENAGTIIITGNSTLINTVTGGTGITNIDNSTGNGATLIFEDNHNTVQTISGGIGIYNDDKFTLTNSTINTTVTAGDGIINSGTLNATDSTLNQHVTAGNAIRNTGPDAAITFNGASTINQTLAGGTGIVNELAATLDITDQSIIKQNILKGTGILNFGTLTIDTDAASTHTATISNDTPLADAQTTLANAIYNDGTSAIALITGASSQHYSIDGRSAAGLFNDNSGTFTINGTSSLTTEVSKNATGIWNQKHSNFTITENATYINNITQLGAGIYNETANFTLSGNSITIANISADNEFYSDGIWNYIQGNFLITGDAQVTSHLLTGEKSTAIFNDDSTFLITGNAKVTNDLATGNGIYNTGAFTILDNLYTLAIVADGTGLANNSTLYNTNAAFDIINSTYTQQITGGNGIDNGPRATLTLQNSTLQNTLSNGNAIINTGTIAINDSRIAGTSTSGNTIHNAATLTLDNSTLSQSLSGTSTAITNTGTNAIINLQNNTRVTLDGTSTQTINATNRSIINIDSTSTLHSATHINLADSTLNSSGIITGAGHLNLLGNSTLNATGTITQTITSTNKTNTLALDSTRAATLTLNGDQDWSNGITLDWLTSSATFDSSHTLTTGSDLLQVNGSLALDNFVLKLSTLNNAPLSTNIALGNSYNWLLATATDGISLNTSDYTFANASQFLSNLLLNPSTLPGTLTLTTDANNLYLTLSLYIDFYWSTGNSTGIWNETAKWEQLAQPNTADTHAHFTRDQDTPATITLEASKTLGNLTIGSENASATTTYTLAGEGINFNSSSGLSTITHHANATTDTIALPITTENDLVISTLNANATLTLAGDITTTGDFNLTKTGAGTLITSSNLNLANGTFSLEQGHVHLQSGTLTASLVTVKTNASISLNGILTGDIRFEDGAIIKNENRLGAKYNDRFTINGPATFNGNSAFYNLAQFNQVVNKLGDIAGRDNRIITDQNNTIYATSFNLDAASSYTLNLSNAGTYLIQDWSIEKDDFGVYYALVISSDINGFDLKNWQINLTDSSGNAWDDTYWSIYKGEVGGIHGIWLHYSNPNRIPEPSTYALITAALILSSVIITRRRKNK